MTQSADATSMKDEVKTSFLNQFTENQNHHQSLFIQFLSSVIVVLAVYAFVYSNTNKHSDDKSTYERVNHDSCYNIPGSVEPVKFSALKFQSIKSKEGTILSYGVIHLIAIYLFTQMVLIILGIILLHLGYAYRRDQHVIIKIRSEALGDDYKNIFGKNFTPLNKTFITYLPDFYRTLFLAVSVIAVILFLSIYIYFSDNDPNAVFLTKVFGNDVTYRKLKFVLSFPFIVLVFYFIMYFMKYNRRINNVHFHDQLSITDRLNTKKLRTVTLICLILGILKFSFSYYVQSDVIMAVGIANLSVAIVAFIFSYIVKQHSNSNGSEDMLIMRDRILKRVISSVIYLSVAIILAVIYLPQFNDRTKVHIVHLPTAILSTLILSILMYVTAHFFQKRFPQTDRNKFYSFDQLKLDSYVNSGVSAVLITIYYSGINSLDTLFAFAVSIWMLSWVVRNIYRITAIYYQRSN